jgi:hypothetical protein
MERSRRRVGKSSVLAEFADLASVGRVARAWRSAAAMAKELTGERRTLVDWRCVRRDCIERDWGQAPHGIGQQLPVDLVLIRGFIELQVKVTVCQTEHGRQMIESFPFPWLRMKVGDQE